MLAQRALQSVLLSTTLKSLADVFLGATDGPAAYVRWIEKEAREMRSLWRGSVSRWHRDDVIHQSAVKRVFFSYAANKMKTRLPSPTCSECKIQNQCSKSMTNCSAKWFESWISKISMMSWRLNIPTYIELLRMCSERLVFIVIVVTKKWVQQDVAELSCISW